jgi:hypothetical protein
MINITTKKHFMAVNIFSVEMYKKILNLQHCAAGGGRVLRGEGVRESL